MSQEEQNRINEENTMYHDIANVAMETQDELIDLTMIEEKPFSRTVPSSSALEADSTPHNVSQEPVSTSTDQVNSSQNGYTAVSSKPVASRSYNSKNSADSTVHLQVTRQPSAQSTPIADNKRKKTDDSNEEIQDKILSLISNSLGKDRVVQRDFEDEDRMFLLSLVSDLKCISSNRKMLVKAEIATAIARGQQQAAEP